MAGDFESRKENLWTPDTPTPAALVVLADLLLVLHLRFGINSAWSHQKRAVQVGFAADYTECPGDNLEQIVDNQVRPSYPGPPP